MKLKIVHHFGVISGTLYMTVDVNGKAVQPFKSLNKVGHLGLNCKRGVEI